MHGLVHWLTLPSKCRTSVKMVFFFFLLHQFFFLIRDREANVAKMFRKLIASSLAWCIKSVCKSPHCGVPSFSSVDVFRASTRLIDVIRDTLLHYITKSKCTPLDRYARMWVSFRMLPQKSEAHDCIGWL